MRSEIENAEADNTQRRYARLAGFLFLGEIIFALGSGFVLSHIAGSGTFAETAKRIAASERLYRAALSTVLIVTLSSVVWVVQPGVMLVDAARGRSYASWEVNG
jgi:hypothetical protein